MATPRRQRPPLVEDDEDDESLTRYSSSRRRSSHTFRRVQRVSRHAALTTKQQLWDSNDVSIDAAFAAVHQWEVGYNALRGLVQAGAHSASKLYGAAKEGAGQLEHGILVPVRDWVLLPAFGGFERAVSETERFLQSEQAKELADHTLELAKKVPVVGENVLAPAMCFSVGFVQRTWEIVQYPIPSKQQVRDTVDFTLNGTKWALTRAGREINLYVKRADANITRTLSSTQWKVLGSGPYATLDKVNKREVIDHLCERYFSLPDAMDRYEVAAHIKRHNAPLYHDLVLTGVLRERGGELTEDDEWLSTCPVYRHLEGPFLIPDEDDEWASTDVVPLWYRLPYLNGNRPGNDVPWICFRSSEQRALEQRYLQIVSEGQVVGQGQEEEMLLGLGNDDTFEATNVTETSGYPTIAKWYVSDTSTDVLVDQKRHAVSFFLCCPNCRRQHESTIPPLAQKQYGDLCDSCREDTKNMPSVAGLLAPPPITAILRPTFWRFHGPGDEVRRATWLLETPRNGLQPFDDEAQAVLEDAYLFLKWMSIRQEFDHDSDLDDALLTVEVTCPDGTDRLVQFSSVTQATAIQKGIFPAVTVFKRRVYRGAWLQEKKSDEAQSLEDKASVERSILQAAEVNGTLGDTFVPDVGLRSVLTPPRLKEEGRLVLYTGKDDLAVPPNRLWHEDMAKYLDDDKNGHVDHLCLIVHGIGEMMRSIDVFGLSLPNLSSIVDCASFLRKNHAEVQDAHFSQMYPTADATARASTGRVEYLPIEWHEAFSILSQRRTASPESSAKKENVMMKDISLRTIPNMREFANDTLMDVLYFMSPEHHDIIVSIVTSEMNVVVQKFIELTGFTGRISVIGHSLGSIISWDILGHQNAHNYLDEQRDSLPGVLSMESIASIGDYASAIDSERSDTPELTPPPKPPMSMQPLSSYPQLDFTVDNFFLLGSPVAVFLMIRNQRKPLTEDFYLHGCSRVFNVFHPYDPIAYRIEPCIDPRNADFEPSIMKHWNGGFRVQYQTKRIWRKLLDTTYQTQQNVVEAFEASMAKMGLIDSTTDALPDDDTESSEVSSDDNRSNHLTLGQLNQGRRIDYMLQEKEIEAANEYVFALAAHSSYWIEKDLSLFVARQIYLSSMEQAAEASWEPIPSVNNEGE